ncbi:MAG: hypothetical protein GX903_03975 [Spirochaetales bacterium]|nr:hypothetical protein [Spirochaetales bacterium]
MSYYCIKCKMNKEDSVSKEIREALLEQDPHAQALFPKRTVNEKQKDKTWKSVTKALLPGYLLISTCVKPTELQPIVIAIKHANYVLRYNSKMYSLEAGDKAYAEWIFNNEGILKPSQVLLEPGERIRVLSGPLLGMEGKIVRVKKRERRAYIELPFAETCNTISLSIDILTKV